MVFVDIYVPSVDKTYNFNLNEKTPIGEVILEITEMIELKERTKLIGEKENLNIYAMQNTAPLPKENTLFDCFVTSGSRLVLV